MEHFILRRVIRDNMQNNIRDNSFFKIYIQFRQCMHSFQNFLGNILPFLSNLRELVTNFHFKTST